MRNDLASKNARVVRFHKIGPAEVLQPKSNGATSDSPGTPRSKPAESWWVTISKSMWKSL
jgi:hypothetical protein